MEAPSCPLSGKWRKCFQGETRWKCFPLSKPCYGVTLSVNIQGSQNIHTVAVADLHVNAILIRLRL